MAFKNHPKRASEQEGMWGRGAVIVVLALSDLTYPRVFMSKKHFPMSLQMSKPAGGGLNFCIWFVLILKLLGMKHCISYQLYGKMPTAFAGSWIAQLP